MATKQSTSNVAHLDQKSQQRYRSMLERAQARLRGDVSALTEQTLAPSGGQAAGELSNAPLHLGDMGTEEFLQNINATLAENEEYLASEVEGALERLAHGTFGECENCHEPIAQARLDFLPYARYCVKCADELDATPALNVEEGAPQAPRDTIAPEGEMQEDDPHTRTPSGHRVPGQSNTTDVHAAGEAGGGTAVGGLAGSNVGDGAPVVATLRHATGSGHSDTTEEEVGQRRPKTVQPIAPGEEYVEEDQP